MTGNSQDPERTPEGGPWFREGDRTVCSTVDELGALWPGARFSSTVDDFYANALRLQFGQFRIETTLNSVYICERDDELIAAHPRPSVSIEIVLEGRMQRQQDGQDYTQAAGQVALTDLNRPWGFTWLTAGRSVRTVTPTATLPPQLQKPHAVPSGLLPVSPLVASYIGFFTGLVDVAQPDTVNHHALEASAIYLHRAVLLDAIRPGPTASTPTLRIRIEDYVALHLAEPDLSPTSIAAAFSTSLRSVHNAFIASDFTLAAEIRRQRVLAATRLLRQDDPPLTMSAIAGRVGFSSADRLSRSFTAVLGMNASEYRTSDVLEGE